MSQLSGPGNPGFFPNPNPLPPSYPVPPPGAFGAVAPSVFGAGMGGAAPSGGATPPGVATGSPFGGIRIQTQPSQSPYPFGTGSPFGGISGADGRYLLSAPMNAVAPLAGSAAVLANIPSRPEPRPLPFPLEPPPPPRPGRPSAQQELQQLLALYEQRLQYLQNHLARLQATLNSFLLLLGSPGMGFPGMNQALLVNIRLIIDAINETQRQIGVVQGNIDRITDILYPPPPRGYL
jgi:hypothetical protein